MLLHGLGTTRQIWYLVTEPLAHHHRRVVTLDLPGFGESAPVGDGFDLGQVTDRLAGALAAHLGLTALAAIRSRHGVSVTRCSRSCGATPHCSTRSSPPARRPRRAHA